MVAITWLTFNKTDMADNNLKGNWTKILITCLCEVFSQCKVISVIAFSVKLVKSTLIHFHE